ncbi:MAG TPA: lecithin retinol acyltransferase family protein, partial [Pirellulaceae bacterium]|nr:lecithin retinol acyltransferase family protein [Pirellulaceae bacterium]
MARGDHLFVPLGGLATHHGIDVGDGTVVHWTSGLDSTEWRGPRGSKDAKRNSAVRRTSSEYFSDGQPVSVRSYRKCLDADEVVRRALERVGERGYSLIWSNCEHFATWCKTMQVPAATAGAEALPLMAARRAASGRAARCIVSSLESRF